MNIKAGDEEINWILTTIELAINIPPKHLRLTSMILSFIGTPLYASTLNSCPQLLSKCFEYVCLYMNSECYSRAVVYQAFLALKQLCDSCKDNLGHTIPNLCSFFLSEACSSLKNRVLLTESISFLIQSLPYEKRQEPLSILSNRIVETLNQTVGNPKNQDIIFNNINCLTALISGLSIEYPMKSNTNYQQRIHALNSLHCIISTASNCIKLTLSSLHKNPRVSIELTNLIDASIKIFETKDNEESPFVLMPHFSKTFLEYFCDLIVQGFGSTQDVIWIESAQSILLCFEMTVPPFHQTQNLSVEFLKLSGELRFCMSNFALQIIRILISNIFNGNDITFNIEPDDPILKSIAHCLESQPEITESFFSFNEFLFRKKFDFTNEIFNNFGILWIAVGGLLVKERSSFRSVLSFLSILVTNRLDNILVLQYLVKGLVVGVVDNFPRSYITNASELLYKIISRHPSQSKNWVQMALSSACTFPQDYKERLLTSIVSTRNVSKFKDLIKNFSAKCRGIEGSGFENAI